MNTNLTPAGSGQTSPFDTIRRVGDAGREFWSARDLMPLLGYSKWENFATSIERAATSAANSGAEQSISRRQEVVAQGGAARVDYELSRFGAYLVAMNGDPRKPEVAAAQAYFAIRTREAETRPVIDGSSITRMELIQIAMNAETERLALETENKVLAPKAEAFDSFLDTTGKFNMGAVAKMIGTSQNKLFRDLRNAGVLIGKGGMRNTPYQRYMHHFEVKAHEYARSNGEMGCSYTTYVQPSGVDFIRRMLNLPSIDPLPGMDA